MTDRRVPVVVDIETEPDLKWLDETEELFQDSLAERDPPDNYESDEAQKQWYQKLFLTAPKKRRKKAALSPMDGRITAIAVAPLWGDMEPIALVNRVSESTLIYDFLAAIPQCTDNQPAVLAGYNVAEFDLPFIVARAAIHEIRLPRWWPDVAKRYGICLDAYDMLGRQRQLGEWLARFGLPPKIGNGKLVATYTDAELQGYVQNDVRVERLLLRRLAAVSPAIRETKPEPTPTP